MRGLILYCVGIFLVGCETTQPMPNEAPQIFIHFQPNYDYSDELAAQPEAQPVIANTQHSKAQIKITPPPAKKTVIKKRPTQTTDLWQHIANNLHFTVYQNRALKKRIKWYLKQPDYLQIVSKRAAPYFYHIVKKVEQQQLPMELALLPFVESGFRPTAYSSQQAVGVWQLVSATAHHFGIKSDQWYDGRQDVLAATDAALDYLSYLHNRFDGNWLHALAAYNSGEGRVKRAIENNKKRGKSTDYWSLKLPKETANYVPKLLALSYLVKYPQQGFNRPQLPYKPLTMPLDIGQQFDFSVIAKLAGISSKQLHKLNPGYLKNQSSPDGPHTLLLPIEQQSQLNSPFLNAKFGDTYTVKQNDTLYDIASRFKLSLSQLKQLNNKQGHHLVIGEKLKLAQVKTPPKSLTINYKISPYIEHQEVVIPTVAVDYKVKPGDTLWSISQFYDVAQSDLAKWNKLTAASLLKPGLQLVLFIPQAETTPAPANKKPLLHALQKTLNQSR